MHLCAIEARSEIMSEAITAAAKRMPVNSARPLRMMFIGGAALFALAGCATREDLAVVAGNAERANSTATQAMSAANMASQTANAAKAAADQAVATANQAMQVAQKAQADAAAANEKAELMYQRSLRKSR
jgi:hypothetical protein